MKKMTTEQILDFIFENSYTDYCSNYIGGLKILDQTVKNQWTSQDVIDSIERAITIEK